MLSAQAIYGAGPNSVWDGSWVAAGRRLFSTLPEDVFDRQPVLCSGGDMLVADLRLDNRAELAAALNIADSDARCLADSAVLSRAWERWGEGCLDRLVGDYAFIVWDERGRRLILVRDPLGTRPLHYHVGSRFVAAASMAKGLHALSDVPYAPDEIRAAEFLATMPEYGSRSFFDGVSRVEPGHLVVLTPSGISTRRFWQPARGSSTRRGVEESAEALRELLDRAVSARLRGAGERIGAHLSGGLDSAAVAATAARSAPAQRVVAFTYVPRPGYEGEGPRGTLEDESELAGATAACYPNIDHVLVPPGDSGFVEDLDRDFHLFERPVVNMDIHRRWSWVNDSAKERGIKVLLVGLMGNFTISYAGLEGLAEMTGSGKWLQAIRQGAGLARSGRLGWPGVLAAALGPWIPRPIWSVISRGRNWDPTYYTALRHERLATLGLIETARDHGSDLSYRPRRDGFETRLWALRRVDRGNNQKGVIAGWGIDLRDPTTDRRLVEFCLSLPASSYLANDTPRGLGLAALADRLPKRVLDERRRGYQAVDWHEGLTDERECLARDIGRLREVPAAAAALDLARMEELIGDWPTTGWNSRETVTQYRMALQRGIVAGSFLRKASRSNA
jgi:asparagine synthase (glutamine-hydrolysing)